MFRSRFFWHWYGGFVSLVLVSAVLFYFTLGSWIEQDTQADIRHELEAGAELLAELATPILRHGPNEDFQQQLRHLGSNIDTRFTVIDEIGLVFAESDENPVQMNNHRHREEVLMAEQHGIGFATRFSATMREVQIYCAKAVHLDGRLEGFVRTAISRQAIEQRLSGLRRLVAAASGLAALLALVLGLFFARRITVPLTKLTAAAESIAAGDLSRQVIVRSDDEIGTLAKAFNTMADHLASRLELITKERNTLETILAGMVEGVIAIDRDERILHMNAVAAALLDLDPLAVRGQRIWEATRVDELTQALGTTLSTGESRSTQARLIHGEREVFLNISAGPLRDGTDQQVGAAVVFHDVSEMRRLEMVRREFVTNASHELKTPITVIRGFLETMAEDPDMPAATRQKFVGRAIVQSDRLTALVVDLLQLSQVEGARDAEEFELLDLREIVSNCIRQLQTAAESNGVALRPELPPRAAQVKGDAPNLDLLVNNLVDNAIKYTEAGGEVRVTVTLDDEYVKLQISDTGIGIAKQHLDRIFERFYRVDKARSRELGGTGLGLAIVKHVCSMLSATVEVQSEPGHGTTFTVLLPRHAAS